jgi:hypothetical protein
MEPPEPTPSLQVELTTRQQLPSLWPTSNAVVRPDGLAVDDATFLGFAGGKDLRCPVQHIEVAPWKRATELPPSEVVGSMVELPTACGQHVVYYPVILIDEAMRGRFYTFCRECACGTAYLIQTESDGAHCKAIDSPQAISELFASLPGQDVLIEGENGAFPCKRLS